MIIEWVSVHIKPGTAAEFEAAVAKARDEILRHVPGCLGIELGAAIEEPNLYGVLIRWETLEAHTEGFRNSPAFQEWRALAGPFFAEPPEVMHYTIPLAAERF